MENNKMYLTTTEAKAKGLGTVQEQIDRYNRAIEIMRNTRPDSPMYQDCQAEVAAIRATEPVENLGACFERNIGGVIMGGR
jgi:hypothetical protein